MSVPKTTADNRVIITGPTDYTVPQKNMCQVNIKEILSVSSSPYLRQWKSFIFASLICKIRTCLANDLLKKFPKESSKTENQSEMLL